MYFPTFFRSPCVPRNSKILGSTKSEPFVHDEHPIVSLVCRELMDSTKEEDDAKSTKKTNKEGVQDVQLSGLSGEHDLDNGKKQRSQITIHSIIL